MSANNQIDHEARWAKFVSAAFTAAKLPDVSVDQLETGTYTNSQIAEHFRANPFGLIALLQGLPEGGGEASRRSILSFAVDMIEPKTTDTSK